MSRVERLWHEAEPFMKQVISRILKAYVSGGAFPASFGIDALSLRQNGSPVNLILQSGTGGRTSDNSGDAVTPCS